MTLPDQSLPKVSLIVGAFNHAPFVERCLDSICAQTHPVGQLIITDDASSDDTTDVIQKYLRSRTIDAKTIFHETNLGICKTFNEALSQVAQPYVAFLSADDFLHPERFFRQVSALESEPDAVLCHTDMYLTDDDGELRSETFMDYHDKSLTNLPRAELFRELSRVDFMSTPSVTMRTEFFKSIGGYDEQLTFEDYDAWLRLSKLGRFVYLDEPLTYYRQHASQMNTMSHATSEKQLAYLLSRLRLHWKHIGYDAISDSSLRTRFGQWAWAAYKLGGPPKELSKYMTYALRLDRTPKRLVQVLIMRLDAGARARSIDYKGAPAEPVN